LTMGLQFEWSLQKCQLASSRRIANHLLTTVPTSKTILQRLLGMKIFSRRWLPHFLSPDQSLLVLKHSKRYCEFYEHVKQIILKEWKRVKSHVFESSIRGSKRVQDREERSFRKHHKQSVRRNSRRGILHRTETNHSQRSATRQQI
jgi:hypothetical protein